MIAILLLVNALVAILMIILILLQRTDPASGGVFGGTGGGNQPIIRNPLAKPTAFLAAIFLINCLTIAYLTKGHENANSIMTVAPAPIMPGTVSGTALPELPAALGGSGSNTGGSPTVPAISHPIIPAIVSATTKK